MSNLDLEDILKEEEIDVLQKVGVGFTEILDELGYKADIKCHTSEEGLLSLAVDITDNVVKCTLFGTSSLIDFAKRYNLLDKVFKASKNKKEDLAKTFFDLAKKNQIYSIIAADMLCLLRTVSASKELKGNNVQKTYH